MTQEEDGSGQQEPTTWLALLARMETQPAYWEQRAPSLFWDRAWYLNALADAGLTLLDEAASVRNQELAGYAIKLLWTATYQAKEEHLRATMRWGLPWALLSGALGTLRGERDLDPRRIGVISRAGGEVAAQLERLRRGDESQHLEEALSHAITWWLSSRRAMHASTATEDWAKSDRLRVSLLSEHRAVENELTPPRRVEAAAELLTFPFSHLDADEADLSVWFDRIAEARIGPDLDNEEELGRFWFHVLFRSILRARDRSTIDFERFVHHAAEPLGLEPSSLKAFFPPLDHTQPAEQDDDRAVGT